ncbi:MAG: DUF502 domain-containing protein [Halanaerobium sp.]|nr:DUF502 domain-containing protein [Halanaerobium sp.]
MLRRIRNYFLTGFFVLLPLIATVYVIWLLFSTIDGAVRSVLELIIGQEVYGSGILVTIVVIFLAGIFATNVLGKKLIATGEKLLAKIPLVRNIYQTVKQVIEALFLKNKTAFKQVVMFEYPRRGIYQLGFLTNTGRGEVQIKTSQEVVCVFLPTTPNPTSGMLVLIPKEDLVYLKMTVEQAMKMIISGGMVVPPYHQAKGINMPEEEGLERQEN